MAKKRIKKKRSEQNERVSKQSEIRAAKRNRRIEKKSLQERLREYNFDKYIPPQVEPIIETFQPQTKSRRISREQRIIAEANKKLQELESGGLLKSSPAATIYLKRYAKEMGIKETPTEFKDNWATKEGMKVTAKWAQKFIEAETSTPTGIERVNFKRKLGIATHFKLDERATDLYLFWAEKIGALMNTYSLGSDVVFDYISDYIDTTFDDEETMKAKREEIVEQFQDVADNVVLRKFGDVYKWVDERTGETFDSKAEILHQKIETIL